MVQRGGVLLAVLSLRLHRVLPRHRAALLPALHAGSKEGFLCLCKAATAAPVLE